MSTRCRRSRGLDIGWSPSASRCGTSGQGWQAPRSIGPDRRRARRGSLRSRPRLTGHHARDAPAARLIAPGGKRLLGLAEVEALIASDALVVDARRTVVRTETTLVPLAGRPVLFALVRALVEAWLEDVSR